MSGGGKTTPEVSLDASLMAGSVDGCASALQPAHDPHRQKYECGEGRDQAVQRPGRQALEEREKIAQTLACSSSATASTATPSPLPIHPIPSFVLALIETVEYPLTSAPARFSRMSSR